MPDLEQRLIQLVYRREITIYMLGWLVRYMATWAWDAEFVTTRARCPLVLPSHISDNLQLSPIGFFSHHPSHTHNSHPLSPLPLLTLFIPHSHSFNPAYFTYTAGFLCAPEDSAIFSSLYSPIQASRWVQLLSSDQLWSHSQIESRILLHCHKLIRPRDTVVLQSTIGFLCLVFTSPSWSTSSDKSFQSYSFFFFFF